MGVFDFFNRKKIRVVRTKNGDWVNQESSTSFLECDNMALALKSDVLTTCIDIFADYASKACFIEKDANGEEIENSEIVNLLNNPNPYCSKEDFIKQLVWYVKCYGWAYQLPLGSTGFTPRVIYNLQTPYINFDKDIKKTLFFKESDLKEVGKYSFTYQDHDTKVKKEYSDIIPFFDVANGLRNNPYTSPSRIDSVKNIISNIVLSSEAENKIINKIGNAMIYKEKSSDQIKNSMPLGKKEQEAIEQGFDSRGVANGNGIIATNVELGYKAVHIPYKDGGFDELLENNLPRVTQLMRIPNELYKAYKEGDTFTNKAEVEVQFIQNVIQPFTDNIARSYNNRFGSNLVSDFSHLPSMAEKENKKYDSALKLSQAIRNLVQSGLSLEEATGYLENIGINTNG